MKKEFKNLSKKWGVDLVGFLNLLDYKSPKSPEPEKYLKGAKSIIILCFRPSSGAYSYNENTWSKMPSYLYTVEAAANTAVYHLSKYLENEQGADVFIVQPHRPFELTEETFRAPVGSISLRHAAVQSHLAVWGKNTLALTPEFGPRVMYMGLLTTLDIPTDEQRKEVKDYNPCENCNFDCKTACPGNAFTEDGKVLSHRCVKKSQPNDVGNFMRFALEIASEPDIKKRINMIKSARLFRHLQYLQCYIHYYCDTCTKRCPALKEIYTTKT
jgi:epoxyqueuosine reductase QueG